MFNWRSFFSESLWVAGRGYSIPFSLFPPSPALCGPSIPLFHPKPSINTVGSSVSPSCPQQCCLVAAEGGSSPAQRHRGLLLGKKTSGKHPSAAKHPSASAPGTSVPPAPCPFSTNLLVFALISFFSRFQPHGFALPAWHRATRRPGERCSKLQRWPHGNQQPRHGDFQL